MSKEWNGHAVTDVRPAVKGDSGFDPNKKQVVVVLPNGANKTVLESEVTDKVDDKPAAAGKEGAAKTM
jgi:hypothetical protein